MILPLAHAFCNVPVMPVRSEGSHRAEQTTQLLFGERAEVISVNKQGWANIQVEWDGYKGWCKLSQLSLISRAEYLRPAKHISGNHKGEIVLPGGDMALCLGSELMGIKGGKLAIGEEKGKFKGKKVAVKSLRPDAGALRHAALQYVYAPYLWGGRSLTGIDCSGLTQMAYKLCNFRIPRDASQQALVGCEVGFLQSAECGDLAFFDNADGNIVHVGMLLDNETIIHATETTGRVVVDRIDPGGIISISLKKRTHNLRVIKRMLV